MCQNEKMIVAVHGVGDQASYETIQAVGRQIFRSQGFKGAIPLGWYYGNLKRDPNDNRAKGFLRYRKICPRRDPQQHEPPCQCCGFDPQHGCFSFTEVYWAGIPRAPEESGYVLEDTKKWAKTVVERLHARQVQRKGEGLNLSRNNYKNIKQVLVEMIDTVAILERLLGWLENHTPLRLHFNRVLINYLGDVQAVADFRQYRNSILKEFRSVMQALYAGNPNGEIYIIAHSEGTVVALLALLKALASSEDNTDYAWIKNVKGLMTIGSPIDKHLILWPELWKKFEHEVIWRQVSEIPWYNYYDYGDPVGFELNTARDWIGKAGNPPLKLKPENDIGFCRYAFPGKAHSDYWGDDAVFRHFIDNVIKKNNPSSDKPTSIWWKSVISAVIPYLLVTSLCAAGTYLLYKATVVAIKGVVSPKNGAIDVVAMDVFWLALILAFATASARIPRLARKTWAWVTSMGLAAGAAGLLYIFDEISTQAAPFNNEFFQAIAMSKNFFQTIEQAFPGLKSDLVWIVPAAIAVGISIIGWVSGVLRPRWGMIPMLAAGFVGIGFLVFMMTKGAQLWPVILAGIGFLYLWRLAALVFDLSFIWHRYIRQNTAMVKMAHIGRGYPAKTAMAQETSALDRMQRNFKLFRPCHQRKGGPTHVQTII